MGDKIKDITGQKIGMLTAIRPTDERKSYKVVWEWKCDCGKTVFRTAHSVKQIANRGYVPSCGCSRIEKEWEKLRLIIKRRTELDL